MDDRKDPNQGEGDRISARRYDRHVEEFVRGGKVPPAAHDAKHYVENDPEGAARAERTARRGPHAYTALAMRALGIARGIVARWWHRRATAASRSR